MRVFLSFLGFMLAGFLPTAASLDGDGGGDRSPVIDPNGVERSPMIDPNG